MQHIQDTFLWNCASRFNLNNCGLCITDNGLPYQVQTLPHNPHDYYTVLRPKLTSSEKRSDCQNCNTFTDIFKITSAKTLTGFLIEVCRLKCQCCDECGIVLQFNCSGDCHCKKEKWESGHKLIQLGYDYLLMYIYYSHECHDVYPLYFQISTHFERSSVYNNALYKI